MLAKCDSKKFRVLNLVKCMKVGESGEYEGEDDVLDGIASGQHGGEDDEMRSGGRDKGG